MRALVVEDEKKLAKNIAQILRENCAYAVDISNTGTEGLHLIKTNEYDLIILDIMLPGIDGLEILKNVRKDGITTAVLLLTAKNSSFDIVTGLNTGADDYLAKPFDIGELVARCNAIVRRSYNKPNPNITAGPLTLNTLTRTITVNGNAVSLTAMEYKTIEYLLMKKNTVVTKTELLEHLYDFNWERYSNVIEAYISSLRRKIDPKRNLKLIETIRGHGYIINEN